MRPFEARYRGHCGICDDDIEPGDDLVFEEDDSLVHADCTDEEVDW
jgi:hypothetical protein